MGRMDLCSLPGACCDIRDPRIWGQGRDVWVQVKFIRVLPEIILVVKPTTSRDSG